MAKTVPLDVATLDWAKGLFADYYRSRTVPPPDRLSRREFAAFPFATETFMRRHATLRTTEEFREFLAREVPRHVYYSSAYYHRPAEPKMDSKGWMGADLIFDLDSDHLRGAEGLTYAQQLDLVKEQLTRLYDDFLTRDFGVTQADATIVFSGGRGYHVHVRTEGLLSLSSPERRELVDYLMGSGIEPARAVESKRESLEIPSGSDQIDELGDAVLVRRSAKAQNYLVPPDTPGWRGRTTRAIIEATYRWEEASRDQVAAELAGYGIAQPRARRWARVLHDKGGAAKVRDNLTLEVFRDAVPREVVEGVTRRSAIQVQGETDAPVTTDIHRLIRLPGSVHGGTGFRAVPVAREALDAFDPFRDALIAPMDGARTEVTFAETVRYPFPGGPVTGRPGETTELPTPVALFLVLRGEASLRPSPAP